MKLFSSQSGRFRRQGFTLLEVLLAMMLGVLLMAGLYFAMNMNLQQTQASRDMVEVEDVSRALFNRISHDLTGILGPDAPQSGGTVTAGLTSSSTSTTSTSTTSTTTTTTPAGVSSASDTSSSTSSSSSSSSSSDPSTTGTVWLFAFQVGVIGNNTQLSIFSSRVPDVLTRPGALNQSATGSSTQVRSDLRRIDYWISANGGLCRKERPWITSDSAGGSDADIDRSTEDQDTIIPNLAEGGFMVEYLDSSGSDAGSWDETSATPPGPPKALRITLTFNIANPTGGEPIQKTIAQVFAIRTSPGIMVPTLVDPVIPSGMTTSGSDDTSSSNSGTSGTSSTSGGGTGGGGAAMGGGGATGGKGGATGGKGGATGGKGGGGGTGGTTGGKGGG